MISTLVWITAYGSNYIEQTFCSIPGYKYSDAILETIITTRAACAVYCQQKADCQSFSYDSLQRTCDLNGYTVNETLQSVATTKHYASYLCADRG